MVLAVKNIILLPCCMIVAWAELSWLMIKETMMLRMRENTFQRAEVTFEPLQINKVGVVDGGHNQVIAPLLCHVCILEHKKPMAE